uniref:DOMON domain-containing protein n=1 Tax=Setaria digitata TaxID=48799 RepID=A0A915PUU8_9BILA
MWTGFYTVKVNICGIKAACQYQRGQYQLRFARDQQYVHLQLTYFRYPTGINTWTGVAFGKSMSDGLDFIGVRVLGDRILVSDEFVRGFRPPVLDVGQNIIVESASLFNGDLRVRLARPIFSNDTADFSLANCLPWQFPTLSPLDPNGRILKHRITPQGMVVCMNRCPCGPASAQNQCQL